MSAFNAAAAVHVALHGAVTLDPAVIPLAEEDFLLVSGISHSTGSALKRRIFNYKDRLIYRRTGQPELSWTIRAAITGFGGLGDAHPGPINRASLAFASGHIPHQFATRAGSTDIGIYFLESASTDHAGGDLPETTLQVSLEFTEHDTLTHAESAPAALTVVPVFGSVSLTYADIPAQPVWTVTTTARTALCRWWFQLVPFEAPATLQPLNGVAEVHTLALAGQWATVSEPGAADTSVLTCDETTWPQRSESATFNALRLHRGAACPVVEDTIDPALTVSPFDYLRLPAAALSLQLTWPWDGADPDPDLRPARMALREFLDATPSIIGTEIFLRFWDADPALPGAVELDTLGVDRADAQWTVDSAGVENAALLTCAFPAPTGGWEVAYVTAELPSLPGWLMKLAKPYTVPEGDPITIPAGDLRLDF